jgi:hypothetical protein
MTAADKMRIYLAEALRKVESKQFKKVSDALQGSLPDITAYLAQTIRSKDTTASERKLAIELYDRILSRVLRDQTTNRKLDAFKKRQNTKVKAPPMSSEDFAAKLVSISNETADAFLTRMQKAQERWKANGGLR